MGLCQVCRELYPPDFTIVVDIDKLGEEFFKCVYCESDKDVLAYDMGDGMRDYPKAECIKDYKELLTQLKNSPKISEILAKKE